RQAGRPRCGPEAAGLTGAVRPRVPRAAGVLRLAGQAARRRSEAEPGVTRVVRAAALPLRSTLFGQLQAGDGLAVADEDTAVGQGRVDHRPAARLRPGQLAIPLRVVLQQTQQARIVEDQQLIIARAD